MRKILAFCLLLLSLASCTSYWEGAGDVKRSEAAINEAKARDIEAATQHRQTMHVIQEAESARTASAKGTLWIVFCALLGGGFVFWVWGRGRADLIQAEVSARDIRADERGLYPIRTWTVYDTRPRSNLYGRDWAVQMVMINPNTGQMVGQLASYNRAEHQIAFQHQALSPPHPSAIEQDAYHRLMIAVGDALVKLAAEKADPGLTAALDEIQTQVRLPDGSTQTALVSRPASKGPAKSPAAGFTA